MAEISPIAAVYALAVIVFVYLLYKKGQKKYSRRIEPLSKEEFPLRDFFPIGYVLLDMVGYQYGTSFDRKLRSQLREIHDPDYTEYYLSVYWCAAASYLALGLLVSAMMAVAAGLSGALGGILLGVILAYVSFEDIKKKVETRHLQIAIEMPDFTNKILILSGAGMTIRAALIKISHEMASNSPLYEELAYSVRMLENGATEEAALERLNVRCNTPQMRRFTSVILQNLHRGGSDVIGALQDIGREQWAERKAAAKKVAEEADTKLLFPMMLMLGAVVLMTIAPAVMSMQI